MCPKYKMCRDENVWHPPYRPNPWAKMVHILAGDHLWDSIKGHRGDF